MSKTNDLKKYFYVFFQLRQRLRGAWHVQLRAVIEKLVANYQKYYTASKYVTVDEQVHPFRWRCGFRVYMPNKPLKYGIKLWCLCDAASAYCANLQVYTGMIDRKREVGQSKRVVLDLVHPTLQSGRNITADNFFRPMDWPKNC